MLQRFSFISLLFKPPCMKILLQKGVINHSYKKVKQIFQTKKHFIINLFKATNK